MMAELRPYLQFWRTVTTVLAPLLLCPLVFVINTPEAKENINLIVSIKYISRKIISLLKKMTFRKLHFVNPGMKKKPLKLIFVVSAPS